MEVPEDREVSLPCCRTVRSEDSLHVFREWLPAWFSNRMMEDNWFFGLLLVTGQTMLIARIDAVSVDVQGNLWLDVIMHCRDDWPAECRGSPLQVMLSPTSRTQASVQAAHVVAAFEMADT